MLNLQRFFGFMLMLIAALMPLLCIYLQTEGPQFLVDEAERINLNNKTAEQGRGTISHLEIATIFLTLILFGIGFYNVVEAE